MEGLELLFWEVRIYISWLWLRFLVGTTNIHFVQYLPPHPIIVSITPVPSSIPILLSLPSVFLPFPISYLFLIRLLTSFSPFLLGFLYFLFFPAMCLLFQFTLPAFLASFSLFLFYPPLKTLFSISRTTHIPIHSLRLLFHQLCFSSIFGILTSTDTALYLWETKGDIEIRNLEIRFWARKGKILKLKSTFDEICTKAISINWINKFWM